MARCIFKNNWPNFLVLFIEKRSTIKHFVAWKFLAYKYRYKLSENGTGSISIETPTWRKRLGKGENEIPGNKCYCKTFDQYAKKEFLLCKCQTKDIEFLNKNCDSISWSPTWSILLSTLTDNSFVRLVREICFDGDFLTFLYSPFN